MVPSREAEVSRTPRMRPVPFQGHLYPRWEGSWPSRASSERHWTSGWGQGWLERPRVSSVQACPLLGSMMALLPSQGAIFFYLTQILTGPPPCACPAHSTGCCRERREGRGHRDLVPVLGEPALFADMMTGCGPAPPQRA